MSVYKPRRRDGDLKSPYYHFDFTIKVNGERRRVHGSTGETTKEKARDFERREKERLKGERPNDNMTLAAACIRYTDEVANRQASADDTAKALEHCCRLIGGARRLVNVTADDIAHAVRRRAGETYGKTKVKAVSAATVNRQIVEPLRRVLYRAKRTWGVSVSPETIEWKQLLMKEPKERVRELTSDEADRFWNVLRADYKPFAWFLVNRGFRVRSVVGMRRSRVDLGRRRVCIWVKGDGWTWVPITAEQAGVLATEMQRTRGEHVWTYAVQKKDRRGARAPITYAGFRRVMRNALKDAAITDLRIHDLRHDFATKLLRATRNLALVKEALRHKDIASTARYAHVLDEDVEQGMEAMSAKIRPVPRNSTGTSDE